MKKDRKTMRKQTRKDREWMLNPDQVKTPKIYNLKVLRRENGTFHVIGGNTMVMERVNQYANHWTPVDTRAFTRVLRKSKITSF